MGIDVRPQWTDKLYRPTSGQDHLGLGSVSSDRILPRLSPGINVLTYHPRYWSFYTFLLDEFWRRNLPRTRGSLARFYRPRECIFAVGTFLCDRSEHDRLGPLGRVVGARKAGAIVGRRPDTYDSQFPYIDYDLGGYGYYYATSIATMGLIAQTLPEAGLPYDAPTPEGRLVAEAFRSAVADTAYYREYFDIDEAEVPADVVLEYIRAACLCQLQTDGAPDRSVLRDVFLHGGRAEEASARRATLRLFLDLGHQTEGHALNGDRFRRLIYFWSDGEGAQYDPPSEVATAARRWRLYQAREYFAYSINRLWSHLCSWGLEESLGGTRTVAIEELWSHVDAALDFADLADVFQVRDPGLRPTSPLHELTAWVVATAGAQGGLDEPWDISREINEHRLYEWARRSGEVPAMVPAMLCLLALLVSRLGQPALAAENAVDWELVREGGVARLGLDRFLRHFRRRSMSGETLRETTHWLLGDYVIRQHERVAVSKLPDDTFRFRRETGDRMRFFDQPAPAFMNDSRFEALATTVYELGFAESLYSDTHRLSAAGRNLLKEGDLPERPVTVAMDEK